MGLFDLLFGKKAQLPHNNPIDLEEAIRKYEELRGHNSAGLSREQLIQAFGGKGGIIHGLLEEKIEGITIPPTAFLLADDPIEEVKEVFMAMRKPVIVRSSHPGDYLGLVGIIPSVKNVYTWKEFLAAIAKIKGVASNERYARYAEDEGTSLTGINYILQEQQQLEFRAIVIRHPGNRDCVIINYCPVDKYAAARKHTIYWESEVIFGRKYEGARLPDEILDKIIGLLEKAEKSKTVDSSYALQLEIGYDIESNVVLYQVRPFKKFARAEFSVDSEGMASVDEFSYGATSEQGIELEIVHVSKERGLRQVPKGDFALVCHYNPEEDHYPIDLSLKGMRVFIELQNSRHLGHGSFRYHQKADVSLLLPKGDLQTLAGLGCTRIRVIADGEIAKVIPVEFDKTKAFFYLNS